VGYDHLKLTHLHCLRPCALSTEEEQVLLMETAMKIRGWVLGDGRSIHSVARETGISRIEAVGRHRSETDG